LNNLTIEKASTVKRWAKEHTKTIVIKPPEAGIADKNIKTIISQNAAFPSGEEFKYVTSPKLKI